MPTIGPIIPAGAPNTAFYLDYVVSQYQPGNYSVMNIALRAYNGPAGSTASQFNGSGSQIGGVDGIDANVVQHVGNPFLPPGYAQNQIRWNTGYVASVHIPHNATGYHANVTVRMTLAYGSVSQAATVSVALPRIAKVPGKPAKASFVSATTTTLSYNFYAPADNGGSALITYNHQIATDSAFTSIVHSFDDPGIPAASTGRAPGTNHYIRYRAVNAIGAGPWSDTLMITTLPAVAPGLNVTPNAAGTNATLLFSPPGGVTGVTKYRWERRTAGTTSPVSTADSTTVTTVVTGLTPDGIYEWRASAFIGVYQSPWTDWQAVTQPGPNTNAGDYFDGSTPAKVDTTYGWTGTVGASSSRAFGKNVTGWMTFGAGTGSTAATGVVMQATGGRSGSFAARVTFFSDAGTYGFVSGVDFTGGSEVEPGGVYAASMYVAADRNQIVQPGIRFYNAAGTHISTTWGSNVSLVALETPVRISVTDVAPATAFKAVPVMRDAAGGSPWDGGDSYLMDDAMVSLGLHPYFSGATPNVTGLTYEWLGTPHNSVSERTQVALAVVDPLTDPDCAPIPAPPSLPQIDSECIVEVGTWRRYTAEVPAAEVAKWSSTLPTLIMATGSVAERQVRIRVYPNPDAVTPDEIDFGTWDAELIITYIPPETVMTLDSVAERLWAEVDGGGQVPANHLLYGTDGVPATWPELRCGIGYVFTLDVPLEAPEGNLTTRVLLTQRA